VYYDHDAEHPFLGQRMATDGGASDATTHVIEGEARKLLAEALDAASKLLQERRTELGALEQLLLEKETIEREELHLLLGPSTTPSRDPMTSAERSDAAFSSS
jgi:ATP-dependent Zn protease